MIANRRLRGNTARDAEKEAHHAKKRRCCSALLEHSKDNPWIRAFFATKRLVLCL
jgi:hypothetical protein